ncbi:serine/threonine-protein kinase [Nonomuraea sp. NPDC049750]|uniref:serine/threonine protein kinase n=1 Tax=Nonomuraea sp. NPDC049750 TaxID=3154738 RepID=UPI0033DA2E03
MEPWQPLQAGDPDECGGFRLTHRLGQGGFGVVYLGSRRDIGDPAAVKIFKPDYAKSSIWRQRFLREIEAIRKMAGVHTAALLDADGSGDPAWLATRYLHAPSLDRLIGGGFGYFDELCGWWLAAGLGEALTEIHAKGILHRDLKPQNILVDQTGLKIIDFGISKFTEEPGITMDASFFGSRQFTANEHILDPRKATEESDVFSLGSVVVYAMIGQTPFHGIDESQRIRGCEPNLDGLPDGMRSWVKKLLSSEPKERPTAMTVFREAFDKLADYAVPLTSESGLPLLSEIRDYIDQWTLQPVPMPDRALVMTGSPSSGTDSSGSSPGAGKSPGVEPPPGRPPKPEFGDVWLARWHEAAEHRRGSYGR